MVPVGAVSWRRVVGVNPLEMRVVDIQADRLEAYFAGQVPAEWPIDGDTPELQNK